jgi:hypothetical protein
MSDRLGLASAWAQALGDGARMWQHRPMTLDQQVSQLLDDAMLTRAERDTAIIRLAAEHGHEAVREAIKRWGLAQREQLFGKPIKLKQ